MRIYAVAWGAITAVLTGLATLELVATGHGAVLAAVTIGLAAFGGLLAMSVCEDDSQRWRWTRLAVKWTAAAAFVWGSLSGAWSSLGALLAVILTLTCPALVRGSHALYASWASRRIAGPPEDLTLRDLQRRWRWTTGEMLRSTSPLPRRLCLVEERRRILDELERRDPALFSAWVVTAVPERPPSRLRHGGSTR